MYTIGDVVIINKDKEEPKRACKIKPPYCDTYVEI